MGLYGVLVGLYGALWGFYGALWGTMGSLWGSVGFLWGAIGLSGQRLLGVPIIVQASQVGGCPTRGVAMGLCGTLWDF